MNLKFMVPSSIYHCICTLSRIVPVNAIKTWKDYSKGYVNLHLTHLDVIIAIAFLGCLITVASIYFLKQIKSYFLNRDLKEIAEYILLPVKYTYPLLLS